MTDIKKNDVKSIIIDNGITTISADLFRGFENLETVRLPNTIKELAECCFADCKKLKGIKVKEEEKDGIEHLLFDIKNPNENYTIFDYQKDGRTLLDKYIKDIEKEITKQETNINEITKELEKQKQDNCILKSKIKNVYGENSNLLKQISKQKKAIALLTLILGGFALVLFYISFSFYR